MARTEAVLPAGTRITDYISLGVVARFFPRDKVDDVLNRTGRVSVRERDLPAHVVVYYVIAPALRDGSYLSSLYASTSDRRHRRNGITVRVIEYRLKDIAGSEPLYRLITTILDPAQAPARELAALYHERWEIETALDELKTHLRGSQIVLRTADGSLCGSRADARSGTEGGRRPRPAFLCACGAGCPALDEPLRRYPPLRRRISCMRRFSTRFFRSVSVPAGIESSRRKAKNEQLQSAAAKARPYPENRPLQTDQDR